KTKKAEKKPAKKIGKKQVKVSAKPNVKVPAKNIKSSKPEVKAKKGKEKTVAVASAKAPKAVKEKTVKPVVPVAVTVPPVAKKEAAPRPERHRKSQKDQTIVPLDPSIDPTKLPKLPKGIVYKRGKGKLAPGEKRLVKTEVITHHIITDKPLETEKKSKPEPKGKFSMEFVIHTPVALLYDFLTTPNGLAEWFADGVDLKNDVYTFDWDGAKQNAAIVSAKLDSYIRLHWVDKPEGTYFEFRLEQDELTNEVSLIVTDFGENPDDIVTSRQLWEAQIHRLVKALGTY
ncbi:MAG TPA: START-like domain-containing protein, partial [Bacteroidia bacterium]|nr:START-like domain-containing protein [Bacteroidia bacterium]